MWGRPHCTSRAVENLDEVRLIIMDLPKFCLQFVEVYEFGVNRLNPANISTAGLFASTTVIRGF